MDLVSERLDVDDYDAAVELFYERRWTDGLPIAPAHNLNGVLQTTHMCVSLVIVNGPMARRLQFNSRDGAFGNGYRANAAVGRAVRLALWNLGGAFPWDTNKSTLSHPGEYAFCIAEEEEDNPWRPLHVERGCPEGSDAVTVFACEAPHSVFCYGTPEEMGVVHEQFRQMERQAGRYPRRYDLDTPDDPSARDRHPGRHPDRGGRRPQLLRAVLPGWGGFGGFAVTRRIEWSS